MNIFLNWIYGNAVAYLDNIFQINLSNNGIPINYNYFLFSINHTGRGTDHASSFKMDYCKIIRDNILIRYYVPCYSTTTVTNADNEQVPENTKGLYDLIEGKFYTNQGTGDFIAGPDI